MRRNLLSSVALAAILTIAPAGIATKANAASAAGMPCTAEHAAMGHCQMAAPAAAPPPSPAPAAPDDPDCPREHAEMGHCTPRTASAAAAVATEAVGNWPAPIARPANQADSIWDPAEMAAARAAMHREHGGGSFRRITLDLAELRFARGEESYAWESDGWFGGDIHRLRLMASGEGAFGEKIEQLELAALYSRAIDPYFNLQVGVRQDAGTAPSRTHLVVGVAGLAPYWLEVDGHAYLSDKGEVRASVEVEYDQRLRQRLILQPRVEFELSAQDIPELGIGAGLSTAELGLRLRYEIEREFAPYIGVVHERRFGAAADFARMAGEHVASTAFVVGVRAWF